MLQLAGVLANWAAQVFEPHSAGIPADRAAQVPRLHSTGVLADRTVRALKLSPAKVLADRAAQGCDRWRCKVERGWMEKWHAGSVTALDKLWVGVMNVTSLGPHWQGSWGQTPMFCAYRKSA